MPLPLAARLLRIGAVAFCVLAVDWALKAWALGAVPVVFNTHHPWWAVLISGVLAIGLIGAARTPLLAFGAGVTIGGGLGNLAELVIFGRVTDFVPLGVPWRGAVWSPADFCLAVGLVLLWIGAVRARAQPSPMPMPGNQGSVNVPMPMTTAPSTYETEARSTAPSAITASPTAQRRPLDMES
jgi:lipoprotein signal peptidase